MVSRRSMPPAMAWNFVSFGFGIFLCCSGYSVARAKVCQLEVAEYKLQVGTALPEVKKVSDTLEKVSNSSALAPIEKRRIQQLTRKSDRILDAVEQEFDLETEKLLKLNIEE